MGDFEDEREDYIRRSSTERSALGRMYGTERHPAAISSKKDGGRTRYSKQQVLIFVIVVLVLATALGVLIAAGLDVS
jgi:hypothetical protein